MLNLLAIYRGRNVNELEAVAVTADIEIVEEVVERILAQPPRNGDDKALGAVEKGRRAALRAILEGR
jgi:hypothetical protein